MSFHMPICVRHVKQIIVNILNELNFSSQAVRYVMHSPIQVKCQIVFCVSLILLK